MPRDGAAAARKSLAAILLLMSIATPGHAQSPNADGATAAPAASGDAGGASAKSENDTAGSSAPATDESSAAGATAPPAETITDPIALAIKAKLADSAIVSKAHKDDVAALAAFYDARKDAPLWIEGSAFLAKAKSVMEEIRKADDWGLEAKAFDVPDLSSGADDAVATADVKLSLAALKYVRFARGGRLAPRSLSPILDLDPPVKDPKVVIADLAVSTSPDAYLRDQHPKHPQFVRLREALIKARGPAPIEAPVDEALKVKLPQGKTLKPKADDPDIALLRQRLKVPAEAGAKETLFDDKLVEAVKAFQFQKGLKVSGSLTPATRSALNTEGEAKKPEPGRDAQRIVINMEKWRWMPEDLGKFYVWNNVPEFMSRAMKNGKEIFKEKIIAGQPEWATPAFSANMHYVTFNPSWGVPDGIKTRELLPRLKKAGGASLFDFFTGGGGGGGAVLRAYGLNAYKNGRPVDPDSVNWGSTDIRTYTFTQPPGEKNPLGFVKFRFPNKHDVYMHDTTQRNLFAQSYRALSHGCMRVQNPRKLADLLLHEDKGWSPERVGQALAASEDVALDKQFPVHSTYFTAIIDEDGKLLTFGDLYGHDSRISSALGGKLIRYDPPASTGEMETASADNDQAMPVNDNKKSKNKEKNKRKREHTSSDLISGALSGLVAN